MSHPSASQRSFAATPLHDGAAALIDFNCKVISQAISLLARYEADKTDAFSGPAGAHLRHVIEHYDALLSPPTAGVVDYDIRVRERALERDIALARQRLQALSKRLSEGAMPLETPLEVRGQGGLAGDVDFVVSSTFGRELVFVASHALHHYALMRPYCQTAGISVSLDFGKAPSTVAHERATTTTTSICSTTSPTHSSSAS